MEKIFEIWEVGDLTPDPQPYGLLHGGVSVVLAETLGSCGAAYAAPAGHRAVGLDINANHLKGVTSGWVSG
ncbi:MAG: hotdog fold thioesterase, partial [Polaromonas sp.]|uniref:PaaI family thioesterase n=1 Tax=Polaromonas sp. TaxID=1869339 RepID=UPI00272F06A0